MHLTETQWQTLQAAMDRIIPPDDFPGAWDAGVGDYLARQFERDLRSFITVYRLGLDGLEAEAQARYASAFAALEASRQDVLLNAVAAGKVTAVWTIAPVSFFTNLVHHVHEGYYADPGNGGNRDAVAWKMIGYGPTEQDQIGYADV